MDRDTTAIGGLKNPLQPTKQLFYVTVVLDVIAVLLSIVVSYFFAMGILFYILASRAYSWRGIRLKKFPVIGFLTVFLLQGAVIFYIVYHACHPEQTLSAPLLSCVVASLLIGALYPLTQIYQHEADKADGVITLSYMLGKRGSFIFSMCMFLLATLGMYFISAAENGLLLFKLFMFFNIPLVAFFLYWMFKVWKNEAAANFKYSFGMNFISTVCMSLLFFTIIYIKHFD
jgi:1,4-dihydroxy-2-naphthoate octaprenyltransferase